jgi:hypothetical protein
MTRNSVKSGKNSILIRPNLLNITRDKMEFKSMFEKEENLFDIMFLNFVVIEIMSRFMNIIDIEDYILILEKYSEVENNDVLLLLIESNVNVIKNIDKPILNKRYLTLLILEKFSSLQLPALF